MDIALCGGEYFIIECGCLNSVGFYDSDIHKIVEAVSLEVDSWKKANIGDTVKTTSGDEFVVLDQMIEDGQQHVWRCKCEAPFDCLFSPCSYGVPSQNFEVINKEIK